MVQVFALGEVALKQRAFSTGPWDRVIPNPLGLAQASVAGWSTEITFSRWDSSFAAVMTQPVHPGVQVQTWVLGGLVACGTSAAHPLSLPQALGATAVPVSLL